MKYINNIYLLALGIFVCNLAMADNLHPIQSCLLSTNNPVQLLSKSHGLDGIELYLDIEGKKEAAFSDMRDVEFVGEVTFRRCTAGVFIFAMTYGPPYQKGIAIRHSGGGIEKILFSEKALPQYIYLSKSNWMLVVPNVGNEVKEKFLIYYFDIQKGQGETALGSDKLPNKKGYSVIKLYSGEPKVP